MPRRKAAIKREVLPDPLYGSEDVAKFINVVMRAGKKSIAEKIVYNALEMLTDRLKKEKDKGDDDSGKGGKGGKSGGSAAKGKSHGHTHEEVMETLRKALGNVAPTVEVKSRRVGGATYQVPVEVASDRGIALAMRWVVNAAKSRSEKTMALRLAAELYEAYLGRGASVKTRDDVHRMAKANQAFAHYRW
ncbi:30S ribosomal protein S7 [Aquicella siphonis]|uniref:Small ribosomal subunit protein uS7 n=1 Tax=Aquicella siphonis TaxID=254247 RepID=A0A5E4PEW7_9COXI|nr:30S ribosomal protein S7 [Aquicella siphonis]VVC75155.1 30S ribosomal protein S7 [Aquicella siphonis]